METQDADGVVPPRTVTGPPSRTDDGPVRDNAGTFRYDVPLDAWTWSPEVYALHGLDVGVPPTTALISERHHPADRDAVADALRRTAETGARLSIAHRVGPPGGEVFRELVLVGEGVADTAGKVSAVRGFYVDISDTVTDRSRAAANEAVAAAVAHRATIEQAKGALILAYGLDDEAAMSLLRQVSSRSNVKLRELAARLMTEVRNGAGSTLTLRSRVDELLVRVSRS